VLYPENKINMRPIREVAYQAHEELLEPYPSFKVSLWPLFSEITGGLRTREFSILCGATGTGKTTFLANLSMQLLTQRVRHYVASVETGDTDFVKRIMSAYIEEDLNTGEPLTLEKIVDIKKRADHILQKDDLYLSIFDNRISIDLLIKDLEAAHVEYGCNLAFLDNLNFFPRSHISTKLCNRNGPCGSRVDYVLQENRHARDHGHAS
jgi:hypothetical protein